MRLANRLPYPMIALFLLVAFSPSPSSAQRSQRLCLNTETGTIRIKRKCNTRRNEKAFSRADYLAASNENASDISTNSSSISTNASNIASNTSSITSNTSGVSSNTSSIATNASAISDIPTPTTVIHVATSGGDVTSISAAIAQASGQSPSSSNPILILVAPGSYSETSTLTIPSHVKLAGWGPAVSKLTTSANPGIVVSDNSTLEGLAITSTSTEEDSAVVSADGVSAGALIQGVSVIRSMNGGFQGFGANFSNSTLELRDSSFSMTSVTGDITTRESAAINLGGGNYTFTGLSISFSEGDTSSGIRARPTTANTLAVRDTSISLDVSALSGSSVRGIFVTDDDGVTNSLTAERLSISGTATNSAYLEGVTCWGTTTTCKVSHSKIELDQISNGNGGISAVLSSIEVQNSVIVTSGGRALEILSGGTLRASNSFLSAPSTVVLGGVVCAGVTDKDFTFYASTCP